MGVITLEGTALLLFTISGAASWINLGVGDGIGHSCTIQNIFAKRRSAAVCSVPIVLYGAVGAGFFREWMRSYAAWVAESADEMRGIGNTHRKYSTVSLIRVALVLSM